MAQLVEQLTLNQWVPGSSPGGCTPRSLSFTGFSYFWSASGLEIVQIDDIPTLSECQFFLDKSKNSVILLPITR